MSKRNSFVIQVSFRYHIQVIKEWRALNQRICVINKKESNVDYDRNDNSLLSRSNHEQEYALLRILNGDHFDTATSQNEENILPEICIVK